MEFSKKTPHGLYYDARFIAPKDRQLIINWLQTLYPIWEERYSKNNPPPEGQSQRQLLRPVYWLGNWQFACLNYYHPPKGIFNRCVKAETFPAVLQKLVDQIENIVHHQFAERDVPRHWHLNTCLVNFYGDKIENGKKVDCARVGEHKDFEPGPVASISIGERAFFQFVKSAGKQAQSQVVFQQWLDDCSLQIFAGERFKRALFHRVQRVENKTGFFLPLKNIDNFKTRRINFTFRYVPDEHIVSYDRLPEPLREDVLPYIQKLAEHSEFFRGELIEDF